MLTGEASFLSAVLDLAALRGWLCVHFRPLRTRRGGWRTAVQGDGAGFPDVVAVRGSRLVVVELKSARGRLTAAQRQWLAALRLTPAEVYLWRPDQWAEIQEVLA
jgi:hypothetical protein